MGSPAWVTHATYIEENFDSGGISSDWWGGNYSKAHWIYPIQSDSDGILVSDDSSLIRLTGVGTAITGDFSLEFGFKLGDTYHTPGGDSLALNIRFGSVQNWGAIVWGNSLTFLQLGGGNFAFGSFPWASPLQEYKVKFVRVGSEVKLYEDKGAGWVLVLTGTNSSTVSEIQLGSFLETPGLTYVQLQADAGLPFDYSVDAIAPTQRITKPISVVLTNQRTSPYKSGIDNIQAKVAIYRRNRLINVPNLPIELWFNYLGGWRKWGDYTTNRFGTKIIHHECDFIPSIDNCLGFARVTWQGKTYDSNIVRFNFIYGVKSETFEYIIDASLEDADRSLFDIFDAMDRNNTYDRMY